MTFADHFSKVAACYAAFRPRYPAALVDLLAELSEPPGVARLQGLPGVVRLQGLPGIVRLQGLPGVAWDVGCGSGQLSVALAERFQRVIATDPSQPQLDAAIAHPRVEYRRASAEASGLADASVDLVVAAQAAHWFDWPRFVAEVARVARPGALVALVSYGNPIIEGAAGREIDRYHDEVAGPYWPKGREQVENGYRDLVMPWPAVERGRDIAMTSEWTRDELVGYVSSWSATARLIELEGPAPFEALRDALAATWPDGERRTIRWPLLIRFARR